MTGLFEALGAVFLGVCALFTIGIWGIFGYSAWRRSGISKDGWQAIGAWVGFFAVVGGFWVLIRAFPDKGPWIMIAICCSAMIGWIVVHKSTAEEDAARADLHDQIRSASPRFWAWLLLVFGVISAAGSNRISNIEEIILLVLVTFLWWNGRNERLPGS